MIYVSDGGWFDAGTEVEVLVDYRPDQSVGLFRGVRNGKVCEKVCEFFGFFLEGELYEAYHRD